MGARFLDWPMKRRRRGDAATLCLSLMPMASCLPNIIEHRSVDKGSLPDARQQGLNDAT